MKEYRFRRSFFGKMILQEKVVVDHFEDVYGTGYIDVIHKDDWRDVQSEDLPEEYEVQITLSEKVFQLQRT